MLKVSDALAGRFFNAYGEPIDGGPAVDGEPILRSLEYNYPNQGYAAVIDEFMMGTDLLVAPQMDKGAATRTVVVPPGTWTADDGTTVVGPKTVTVATPLSRLPHFVRAK